jgi:Tol biopolymer transport system component
MNIDGSDATLIYEGAAQLRHPAWSPDGNAFVFTAWNGTLLRAQRRLYFYDMLNQELLMAD